VALALCAAPAAGASAGTPTARASATYGPAMSTREIRAIQAQGVREIIVKRDPGLSATQQAAVRSQAGISYVGPGPLPNTEVDRAPTGRLAAAVAALRQDPQVQYAEPNGQMHATAIPNDAYFSYQWALENTGQYVWDTSGTPGDDIGALYAWPHSTGTGVTVAVVDTGADYTAPDLSGRLLTGHDYLDPTNNAQDQNGHGTHVAGIIAADQNNNIGVSGVAPSASLVPLRVLDASGSGSLTDVATAFADAGQAGYPIVNASLGGSWTSQTLTDAVTGHPNTLYVVAAGNDGANNDDPASPFYPCDIPAANLICVGASDQNDQPAYFSNYGATNVDLFAPGVNILSTYPGGYAYDDGTSMATPMVSGTLALMLAHNPSLTAAQLKSDLLASVDQSPQLAGLAVTGGELDAAAAVAAAGGDTPYAAPGNREAPQVLGATTVGATLSADTGSWSRLPTAYAYQWQRCVLGACQAVPAATGASYTLGAGDYGATFNVAVTASNAAGSTRAVSAATAAVGTPTPTPGPVSAPAASPATAPAPTPAAPAPASPVRLSHVALVGKHGGSTVVFTLSARALVQITLARTAHARGSAADVLRRAFAARKGQNRFALRSLLRGRRMPRGKYALTVRAGNRTATLRLTL
jgi:subtilisin family serine protease